MALGNFGGGGLGMGVAFNLKDNFSRTADQIESKMRGLGDSTEVLSTRISNSYKMMTGGAVALAVGIGGLAFFKKSSDVRAAFQSYEVQFETLLGSAEKAKNFFKGIQDDAFGSIMATKELVATNAEMIGTGVVSEEQSRRITKNMGEIIAGTGGANAELKTMASVMSRVAAEGKVTLLTLQRFKSANVPIRAILANLQGVDIKNVDYSNIGLDELDAAFAKATSEGNKYHGAMARAKDTTKGAAAAYAGMGVLIQERVGKAIETATSGMYKSLVKLQKVVYKFLDTDLGQKVAKWILYFTIFITILGAIVLVMGVASIGAIKLGQSYLKLSVDELAATSTGKLLSMSMRKLAISTWAAIGPYVIIAAALIAFYLVAKKAWDMITKGNETMARWGAVILIILGPIGLIIGAVAGLKRGFEELSKPTKDMAHTGILGFFTKVAAIIKLVRQVWKSWNGENAQMTEQLGKRLGRLRIWKFAQEVIRLTIKIKEFFTKLKKGIEPLKDTLKKFRSFLKDKLLVIWTTLKESMSGVWNRIKKAMQPVIKIFKKLINKIFAGKDGVDKFGTAGEVIGKILAKLGAFYVEYLKGIFTVIIFVLKWTIKLVGWLLQGIIWLIGKIFEGIIWLTEKFMAFGDFMRNLPSKIGDIGSSIISSIWNGIKSGWTALVEWIKKAAAGLADIITSPFESIGSSIKSFFGGDDGSDHNINVNKNTTGGVVPAYASGGSNHFLPSSTKNIINNNNQTTQKDNQPLVIINQLDGEDISKNVIDRQNRNESRKE